MPGFFEWLQQDMLGEDAFKEKEKFWGNSTTKTGQRMGGRHEAVLLIMDCEYRLFFEKKNIKNF